MERKTPEEMFGEVFMDLGLTPEQKAGARMNPPDRVTIENTGGAPLIINGQEIPPHTWIDSDGNFGPTDAQ